MVIQYLSVHFSLLNSKPYQLFGKIVYKTQYKYII